MPTYDYECEKCGIIEIFHGMMEDDRTICPECETGGLTKMIGAGGAIIMKGRMANQYNDIKKAKYWRDQNGVRHRVTSSDGHSGSPTVPRKKTKSDTEVDAIKKNFKAKSKKRRSVDSYRRYVDQVARLKRQ